MTRFFNHFPKRWRVIAVVIGLPLLAVGISLWALPSFRVLSVQGFWLSASWLGLVEARDVEAKAATPTPDPLTRLAEQLNQLQQKQQLEEQEIAALKMGSSQLQEQLKAAIAEVAKGNDLAAKQEEDWLATVKGYQAASPTATPAVSAKKINLNTASAAELDSLPGIGPAYAERIITYRQQKGPFHSIDDLENIAGIGPATVEKLKPLVEI